MSEDTTTEAGQPGPVTYRNTTNGETVTIDGGSADLDARDNWVRVAGAPLPQADDADAVADGLVAYRNLNTDTIHLHQGPNADLEARPNFVRVSLDNLPATALDAAQRAIVERNAAERAAVTRAAGGFTGEPTSDPLMATAAHANPGGFNDSRGVLSRPGMNDNTRPTREDLLARERAERESPDRRGVIARGESDQVQAGVRPAAKTAKAAKAAAAKAKTDEPAAAPVVAETTDPGTGDPVGVDATNGGGELDTAGQAAVKADQAKAAEKPSAQAE